LIKAKFHFFLRARDASYSSDEGIVKFVFKGTYNVDYYSVEGASWVTFIVSDSRSKLKFLHPESVTGKIFSDVQFISSGKKAENGMGVSF
jgi:hypothetical protein